MNQTADLFKYEQVGALKCSLHDSESYHVSANNYTAYLPLQKLEVSDVRERPSELDIMQQDGAAALHSHTYTLLFQGTRSLRRLPYLAFKTAFATGH